MYKRQVNDSSRRTALLQGLSAYLMWGFVVLFWPLLKHVPAWEILAHRIVWSLVIVAAAPVVLPRPWRGGGTITVAWAPPMPAQGLCPPAWGGFVRCGNSAPSAQRGGGC